MEPKKNLPGSFPDRGFDRVQDFIARHKLIMPNDTVVIGLSGGPDSVFLFHALLYLRTHTPCTIIAAHLNHEWRTSAVDDEQFCHRLCQQYDIPLASMRASQLSIQPRNRGSKEDLGRQLRRALFSHVKQEYQAQHIALAHHADDQIETFFIRLIRGATVVGLASMRPRHGAYIRPLLPLRKQEILEYLAKHALEYVTDPTNASTDFLRNRIRQTLTPELPAIDVRAITNIAKAIGHLQDTEQFLQRLTDKHTQNCLLAPATIDMDRLANLDPFLQKRIIVDWLCHNGVSCNLSSALIDEILRFLSNNKSVTHQFYGWQLHKSKRTVTIQKTSVLS